MDFGTYPTLQLEHAGPALIVTVNRPEALNALAGQVVEDLTQLLLVLSELGREGQWPVRGVILTGAGEKSFVAGADIVEMNTMDAQAATEYGRKMHRVTLALEALPVPVIAAVNGFALGGGCELALACDYIYASSNARFGQPEVNLGLVPGFGGAVRLPRRVSPGMAREMIFSARPIKADEAYRIGLVNAVFDNKAALLEAAQEAVAELATKSPTAVANAKAAMSAMVGLSTVDALEVESTSFHSAFLTEDSVEGRNAFVAKRAAQFPGS
ncbi:enoyl-CoA hydratase/isomerase family protein [Galactobacter caseinivorans]|uniref:enoyl-CoA hydratase n=1 Tax=Galactobacter caseinivorans TaxID=2676123 RepID=A0A496PIJ0_9MICC|nr:enoyl-CoA hydratase-related protein [Galactobacter caseinivorans]RKW70314.1 enoyl-CoA hydratase [Galactobacter caseinivorans]